MPRIKVETIILEPITPIISFEAISHRTYKSVSGAVGHYRYPSDKEYEAKKKAFYNSAIGRKNKQKISEVISEIYAYLNTRISEYADPADYYFRLSLNLEVNKETAEIFGNPSFDIDVFRHIGKIGGKHSSIGNYSMKVILVDKEKSPLSPIFKKGINKAKQETGLIEFTMYDSYSKAPNEIKEKITKDSHYLIVDEEAYKIEPEIDSKKDVFYRIEEKGNTIEFRSENDMFNYILKKVKIIPKIISSETGLTLVDKEIIGISKGLEKAETEPKIDIMTRLGIEQTLTELFGKLEGFRARANSEKAKRKERYRANLEEIQKEFTSLKVDYEVQETELARYEEEYAKQVITEENYRIYRVKTLRAMAHIRTNLIDLQQALKDTCSKEIEDLMGIQDKGAK
jgi:hypothetical protein